VAKATAGKTIALFALPGAFTPTCSAKHVPGYLENHAALTAAGVDEIWCVSVNDAFVMGAWGRELHAAGKVRMLGDGDAEFTKATGLTLDLTGKGLGLRSNRYSLVLVPVYLSGEHRVLSARHSWKSKGHWIPSYLVLLLTKSGYLLSEAELLARLPNDFLLANSFAIFAA
jgi:peroxiredoxin